MKIHDCLQGSELWLWHRLGIPTASEFHRIIQPKKGELSAGVDGYIAELIAETICPDYTGGFTSRAMWAGTTIEADARDWYAYAHGPVREVGFVTDDDGRWGCSPDGLGDGVGLELKGPTPKVHVGYMLNPQSLADEYKTQAHGGMVVCECRRWNLMSYCPPFEPVLVRFEWDEFSDNLSGKLALFSERYEAARERFAEANGGPIVKPPKPVVREVPDPVWMDTGPEPVNPLV